MLKRGMMKTGAMNRRKSWSDVRASQEISQASDPVVRKNQVMATITRLEIIKVRMKDLKVSVI